MKTKTMCEFRKTGLNFFDKVRGRHGAPVCQGAQSHAPHSVTFIFYSNGHTLLALATCKLQI